MDNLLRRYVYKDYLKLLEDRDFEKFLRSNSWVRPAIIPKSGSTKGSALIRKYIVKGKEELIKDSEFQRILYRVGFTRYTTTTTSTTTTSTTTP